MAMTEEKARMKWCPFARRLTWSVSGGVPIPGSINRTTDKGRGDSGCRCLASDCMMWQRVIGDDVHGFCGLVQMANLTAED